MLIYKNVMCLVYLSCILLAMHCIFQSRIFLVKYMLYFFIDSLSESSLFSYSPLILICEAYSLTYLMFIVFQLWRFSAMFDTWATSSLRGLLSSPVCNHTSLILSMPPLMLLKNAWWYIESDLPTVTFAALYFVVCLFSDLPGIIQCDSCTVCGHRYLS